MTDPIQQRLTGELDAYLDAVPRAEADPATGAITLFVSRTASSYYARPAPAARRQVPVARTNEMSRCPVCPRT